MFDLILFSKNKYININKVEMREKIGD